MGNAEDWKDLQGASHSGGIGEVPSPSDFLPLDGRSQHVLLQSQKSESQSNVDQLHGSNTRSYRSLAGLTSIFDYFVLSALHIILVLCFN
jgi:hypothetical protein